jgi:hypothetical protein
LTADRAMQHLIWLCGDADALYDVALGMYDLELAAMVAAQAQMDPKEFLPYLQVCTITLSIFCFDNCFHDALLKDVLSPRFEMAFVKLSVRMTSCCL